MVHSNFVAVYLKLATNVNLFRKIIFTRLYKAYSERTMKSLVTKENNRLDLMGFSIKKMLYDLYLSFTFIINL